MGPWWDGGGGSWAWGGSVAALLISARVGTGCCGDPQLERVWRRQQKVRAERVPSLFWKEKKNIEISCRTVICKSLVLKYHNIVFFINLIHYKRKLAVCSVILTSL